MKTAVLEFQRNRVKRQLSGAASIDILKTIVELRSALEGIGKAILAVERLALAHSSEGPWRPRKSVSPQNKKKLRANSSKAKRKSRVITLHHSPDDHHNQPAVPDSAGTQT